MSWNSDRTRVQISSREFEKSSLPCLQRITHRWKTLLIATVIITQTIIIVYYSNSQCHHDTQIVRSNSCTETRSTIESTREEDASSHDKESQQPQQRLPHFIVIGVKKCGTRALLNFLKIHPDIVAATSEVHFFDREENYDLGLEWYRKEMPYSTTDQLTGEKSPAYYRTPEAPFRIHKMNSTIKLLAVVREPVERSMSNYLQYSSGNTDTISFDEAVLDADGNVNPQSPHIYNSDYNLFIDNWLKYFSKDQLKFVDGNLLISAPYQVMEEIQTFLGVRQYITKDFFQFNEQKGFYCYKNSSKHLKCLGDSKGRPHPAMNPSTRAKLVKYFAPRNAIFFSKINRNFDWG